jgi:signal transduction histidine kinase/HAMP domain-containing protein
MKRLKSKILLGLVFLLSVILLLSLTGIISIYYLSQDSDAIIRDNYTSVEFSTNMLEAVDGIYSNQLLIINALTQSPQLVSVLEDSLLKNKIMFEKNLELQKNHIAEPGEEESVNKVIVSYQSFISLLTLPNKANTLYNISNINELKLKYNNTASAVKELFEINMKAIYKKNSVANKTADKVSTYMAIATVASILLTIMFIFYFPSYIVSPINELKKKIDEISIKKYDQRIEVQSNDELSELALAFNKMALKLKEYETQHIDELLLEKRRMETLLVNLQDATLLLDNNFRIHHVNNKFCELAEKNVTELLEKKISELDSNNEIMAYIHSIDLNKGKLLLTQKIRPVEMMVGDHTEYFQILLLEIHKGIRSEINSEPSGYILLIQNVTKYEERDLAKTNLIATISHELKTPLSSINLSIKLLEDERIGNLNEEQRGITKALKLHSNRILNLVNEVLDYAQAETGHINTVIKTYDVNEIIEPGHAAVIMLLNEKQINFNYELPKKLPKVKCDLEKSVWVLVNLLTNAVHYSKLGSNIFIQVKPVNDFVLVYVKDEGPGISKDNQKKIFERYVKSESDSGKGTGLGLAIAKEFVEAQGGTIGVESTLGKGSKFYFSIPTV